MTQIRAEKPPRSQNFGPSGARGSAPRLEPRASVRLTGRGAMAALFALCFGSQWIAARNIPGAVSSCAQADPAKNSSGGATTTARRPLVLV